ncbi:hypothetical protein L211DRAFT_854417 [Terfezia boudieri ATCC MYA-4762]|uniref:Uncharacterized protein n=1 Tax=Terfezia boudieri ATCC MYA-4762 TaxID=1051890 RepID=A0A3N4L5E5_9PEZI|nr:hypothetical protein L211DRAFT_854417 [Terfezia boudieri ATCC MYA-4762]
MYRDSAHRNNWLAYQECSDLHTSAIFSDWLKFRVDPTSIRLGLFMSLQYTWVGNQRVNHDYPQHVWAAGLRQAPGGVRGKELILWDNDWDRKRVDLVAANKRLSVNYRLIGGQRALYKYLKGTTQGRLNIYKIWIAGNGEREQCLSNSVAWLEHILQTGGLDGDLAALGFCNLCK